MKKFNTLLLLLLASLALHAQSNRSDKKAEREQKKLRKISLFREIEEGENLYNREFSGGARLNTDGWTGFLEMGYRKSASTVNFFQFEFSEKKDPKQDRSSTFVPVMGYYISTSPYVYGKMNNFYQAKLGLGQKRLIGGKGNKNGVEVNAIYYGGISAGLVKPYYLELMNDAGDPDSRKLQKWTPENNDEFLDKTNIYGAGGFSKGWGEVKFNPGLHAKLGFRFDWAKFNDVISALEVGVNAEYYTKKVQIMVDQDGKSFFFNAYVGLQLGKRWNK
ncbi:hypothetical protein [Chitinophaga rhizosphaerae]|uniref:hypothetical protein n=1 Tax=Chitinophaga rhizosphaerae TaxID=1864947 RepID=UPI000F8080CF|nr:hypothetical protein [Chitinophaga rhizosphaerae]